MYLCRKNAACPETEQAALKQIVLISFADGNAGSIACSSRGVCQQLANDHHSCRSTFFLLGKSHGFFFIPSTIRQELFPILVGQIHIVDNILAGKPTLAV